MGASLTQVRALAGASHGGNQDLLLFLEGSFSHSLHCLSVGEITQKAPKDLVAFLRDSDGAQVLVLSSLWLLSGTSTTPTTVSTESAYSGPGASVI